MKKPEETLKFISEPKNTDDIPTLEDNIYVEVIDEEKRVNEEKIAVRKFSDRISRAVWPEYAILFTGALALVAVLVIALGRLLT